MSPLIEKSCFALLENLNNHVSNSRGSFDIWRFVYSNELSLLENNNNYK